MTLPYYPFYWCDYSAKTYNLTTHQHGVYMLLLRHTYVEQTRIPDEEKYAIAKAFDAESRLDVDYILAKFWLRKNGVWFNLRAEEIIEEQHKIHEANVIKGKKGGRPAKVGVKLGLSSSKVGPKQLEPELNKKEGKPFFEGKNEEQSVIIETGGKACMAWEKHIGHSLPSVPLRIKGRLTKGWYVATEFPPADVPHETKSLPQEGKAA